MAEYDNEITEIALSVVEKYKKIHPQRIDEIWLDLYNDAQKYAPRALQKKISILNNESPDKIISSLVEEYIRFLSGKTSPLCIILIVDQNSSIIRIRTNNPKCCNPESYIVNLLPKDFIGIINTIFSKANTDIAKLQNVFKYFNFAYFDPEISIPNRQVYQTSK